MKHRSPRWSAWLVLASIVGNQVLFAYEPERSYWEQRRQEKAKRFADPTGPLLARGPSLGGSTVLPAVEKISPRADFARVVSLPAGLNESVRSYFSAVPIANATIRKIHLPKNGNPRGLVFHILDVHRNLDAQTNIAHTVTSLIGLPLSSPIAMVGLEGAFRPYDLTWLRSFPDPGATRLAAEDLLAQDKMSGPMFSLLTASTPIPPVIGIDDESHYQANLSAYRRSLVSKETDRGHIKNRAAQLGREKSVAFNKELKAFDQTVQAYHRGTASLGTYTRALAHKEASPLAKPIALFLQALEKEETLDFKEVERERGRLLESLAQKMSPSQTNELISRSMAYRAGQLAYGDFYRWIKTLCDAVDVPLTRFPAMNEYIHYVLLSETINAEELLEECRQREKNLFDLLAKTDVERTLVAQSHALTLTEKLLDFSLTPDEWADYEQVRGRAGEGLELEPYESFYKQAHARDGAMAQNVLGVMEKSANTPASAVPVSIIVTGGYHGPGLNDKLTRAGMAVVTVVPKIEKIDTAQGSSYLTVFAQEKTPLDKLFEGAKLFVADAPLPQTTAALQAAGAAMVSHTTNESFPPKTLAFLKKHFQRVSVVQDDGISEVTLTLFDKKFTVRYDPSQSMGKKIQAGQPSDLNFFQQWFQSRGIDGRILTIGSALIVAGVWFFISGPTALHQMGPLVSAIGLLMILGLWTSDGRLVALSTSTRPFSARLDQSPVRMALESTNEGMSQTGSENSAMSGRDPAVRSVVKGVVDLKKDPTFWKRLLTDPRYKGFVFYFDPSTGSYEIYSRENHPGDLADHPDDEISELFRIQHRVNVRWGAPVDSNGIPELSHFFLTHADHKPLIIVFPKSGGDPAVYEGYSDAVKESMENARFVVVHNPDRAKRPGRDAAEQTKEQAERNPGMKVLTPQYIYDHFPMEIWLTWTSPDGGKYIKTANLAGYIPNDPYGDPRKQIDHTTMSHASNTSQGELMAPWAIQDSLNAFFNQGKSDREKIRVTGNGWYYRDFSAGASQNILHNHLVRLVLLIERAGRTIVGSEGRVTVGILNDDEDARATYFEIGSKDNLPTLVNALGIAYRKITQKGHSFNFIIAPNGASGARVFVGDKIAGVPEGEFPNPSAFAEFGLVFIVDNPTYAFNLTDSQVDELKTTENVAEWVIRKWRAGSITLRADLKDKCANSINKVSASKQDYKDLAQEVLAELRSPQSIQLDSILSRTLNNKSSKAKTRSAKIFWTMAKAINDFVAAPIYETALFFLLPAMSGSILLLMVGVLIFVAVHYWDDYQGGQSRGAALQGAISRFWRATVLYAMPFALFIVPSELIPFLQQVGFESLFSLVQDSSLFNIAGTVALIHSGRNFLKFVSAFLKEKFPALGSRKDTSWLIVLLGLPIVANASSLVDNPSLPFLFLAALPWQAILGVLGGAVLVGGLVLFYRAVFLSGGNVSDEKEAIDHILGSGLPHRFTAPLLLHVAIHTEDEEVARLAVRPIIAPWRNLNLDLDQAKTRFTKMGWTGLANEVSGKWEHNTKWLTALAGSDARHIADVVFLGEDPFVNGSQDASLKTLIEVFPTIGSLNIQALGFPGLNQIENIGLDLRRKEYEAAFKENIVGFYSDLKMSESEDAPPFPTVNQSLARLRKFAAVDVKTGVDENRPPVQLEVYTLADIETARETIQLLQAINKGEETPVRLLLAGADQTAVNALKAAAEGVANVAIADLPVATHNEETKTWNLETSILNRQFDGLKGILGIGDEFALEVSLSETIAVERSTLDSQSTEQLNEALKQALLRFILNEPRLFHFNAMLKIVLAIKQSA